MLDAAMPDARTPFPLSPQQFQILLALTDEDRHGYGIIADVADRTNGAVDVTIPLGRSIPPSLDSSRWSSLSRPPVATRTIHGGGTTR